MKILSWLAKGLIGLVILIIIAIGGLWLLLPDRYVVNTPLRALFKTQPLNLLALESQLTLPAGFSLSLYATDLDGIRVLRFTPAGDLLVSTPRTGRVWLLRRSADGSDVKKSVLLENLNRPHGLEVHDGWLYVAETDSVGRIKFAADTATTRGEFQRIVTIPGAGMHWTRTVRHGPDGWFYLTVGSNCNACEDIPLRAAMHRFKADGSQFETFATGLRNSVDFGWAPWNNLLYATDNGRDLLGDDLPPCELNQVVKDGFYGWPYAWGDRQPDPELGEENSQRVTESTGPVHDFNAHTAPLGIVFLEGDNLPTDYKRTALVAQHGSWNRTSKAGYRLVSLHWDDAGNITERNFLTGFEKNERVIGRPAFIEQGPDGAIYISDDFTGSIYRVAYGETTAARSNTRSLAGNKELPLANLSTASLAKGISEGSQLYEHYACASCHDTKQGGNGIITVPLAGLAERYSLETMDALLATPTPPMPLFPLSAAERQALAIYLLDRFPTS